jgi:hypothetical protein
MFDAVGTIGYLFGALIPILLVIYLINKWFFKKKE